MLACVRVCVYLYSGNDDDDDEVCKGFLLPWRENRCHATFLFQEFFFHSIHAFYTVLFLYYFFLLFQDIIGRTDVEIFSGAGVKESQDFKKEVMDRGLPAKREITFETELFGSKTFLIHVEPVFSKSGDTIGVNYVGMDVTDQVRRCS